MPLIEANFIYITILLLGTLGYVYTLQRPTTYMIRPSRNKDLYKSSNPSKVNFDIKGTQFTYLSSLQTARDSQDAILNSQTCLY